MTEEVDHSQDAKPGFLRRFFLPSWSDRKRMLRIEAWVFLAVCYGVVVFAILWPADFRNESPAYVAAAWTAFMVRTFLFHLGLVLAVIAALAAWARSWRLFATALPLVLVTTGPALWDYRPRAKPVIAGEPVTVMSVNLLMINENTAPIIGEIAAIEPDVLLLQEYTRHWHAALQEALGPAYPYVRYVTQSDSFGAAIYSRRPFVGEPERYLPLSVGDLPQIRAVIEIGGRDVAIYNIHLLPPYGLDYTTEGRVQFADLLDLLAAEKLPVIIAGDFNFAETSPHAAALRRLGLADAFSVGGWGRGTTWPVHGYFRWIPSLRLDHVYLDSQFACADCATGVGKGSDHRPVIARVGFRR